MPFIKANDGTQLFYREAGAGKPVVLIHGWPLNGDMWEYQVPALVAQGRRVITYDRRGFGQSDQPWIGYDYDTFADDLKALLDQLDLRDVALVGFSMGGGEIARYIGRHGTGRIAKAVLVSAVTPFMLRPPIMRTARRARLSMTSSKVCRKIGRISLQVSERPSLASG